MSETTITPRIAVLPWENHSVDALTDSYKYHYSDSATIWNSRVSASPNMIVKQIYYKDATNLQDLVTGCYDRKTGSHNQITKEQLKKYGLTFRQRLIIMVQRMVQTSRSLLLLLQKVSLLQRLLQV